MSSMAPEVAAAAQTFPRQLRELMLAQPLQWQQGGVSMQVHACAGMWLLALLEVYAAGL